MRQVGDRLIPVGVTSGRVHALSPEEAQAEGVEAASERGMSRRARRRQQNQELNQYLGSMGLGGQDLEEVSRIGDYMLCEQCILTWSMLRLAHGYGGFATFAH